MTHDHALHPVSRRTALAGLGAGGLGLALAAPVHQAAAQGAMAGHPLVGIWLFANDPADPANVSPNAFLPNGTLIFVTRDIGTGLGQWSATGDRTAEASPIALDTHTGPNGTAPGTVTGHITYEVDATGNALTAENIIRARDPEGNVVLEFSFTATGTRVGIEPATLPGTPTATTPTS